MFGNLFKHSKNGMFSLLAAQLLNLLVAEEVVEAGEGRELRAEEEGGP
jgi:hypothetical protein